VYDDVGGRWSHKFCSKEVICMSAAILYSLWVCVLEMYV
jgi:hypothetical protein